MLPENHPQGLLKIVSKSVTQNWFRKDYSKLVPFVLLEIDPQTLLKIRLTKVTQSTLTNISQNWFGKCYSKLVS